VLATGAAALLETGPALPAPLDDKTQESIWRNRIAQDPTDVEALLVLGRELQRAGKRQEAEATARLALQLAPADRRVLLESAGFYLRGHDDAKALPILRRAVDLYPALGPEVWSVFTAALPARQHGEFFLGLARESPVWWPAFFEYACTNTVDSGALQAVFSARVDAANVTDPERSCLIGRIQREGRWADAHQLWLNSLPAEQKRLVGNVFNGSFEWPLSSIGFDWIVPVQDGMAAEPQSVEGAQGKRALRVVFVNKRFSAPPIYQYLTLSPGRYRLQGMGRPEGLETWLGVQWGLYCMPEAGKEPRQLAKSDRFLGSEDWLNFHQEFAVPGGCSVQILRLELANPRRDAETPGAVAARLRGTVWFDDIKVIALD
jgi:tetratricopeptide (TPR) repeat protein